MNSTGDDPENRRNRNTRVYLDISSVRTVCGWTSRRLSSASRLGQSGLGNNFQQQLVEQRHELEQGLVVRRVPVEQQLVVRRLPVEHPLVVWQLVQ